MKTLLSSVLAVAALAASPFISAAEEEYRWYAGVGFGVGSGEEEYDSNISWLNGSADFDSTGYKISGGYIFSQAARMEISFAGEEMEFTDADVTDNFTSLDVDGIFTFTDHPVVRPYVLAGIGFTTYEDTEDLTEEGENLNGISLQLGAGVIWKLAPRFELDGGFKYRSVSWQKLEDDSSSANLEISTSMTQFTAACRVLF